MENQKIKDRITALLSKTIDNGATKHEMESALVKANKLMLEHFISECDLKNDAIKSKCISASFDVVKSGYNLTSFYAYLAQLFDCEYYYNPRKITFFGHENDVEMCGYFYELIAKSTLLEAKKFMKSEEGIYLKKYSNGRTIAANFIRGFLNGVSIKMQTMYYERKSNIPQSYGLMVIEKKKQIDDEFSNLNLKITVKKSKEIKAENESFFVGQEAGKDFQLTQGLNAEKNTELISN